MLYYFRSGYNGMYAGVHLYQFKSHSDSRVNKERWALRNPTVMNKPTKILSIGHQRDLNTTKVISANNIIEGESGLIAFVFEKLPKMIEDVIE